MTSVGTNNIRTHTASNKSNSAGDTYSGLGSPSAGAILQAHGGTSLGSDQLQQHMQLEESFVVKALRDKLDEATAKLAAAEAAHQRITVALRQRDNELSRVTRTGADGVVIPGSGGGGGGGGWSSERGAASGMEYNVQIANADKANR
jgi:hypothetical protein